MRRFITLAALLVLLPSTAFATWSVVAVDRNTGRIVIASATCLALEEPTSLKGFQSRDCPWCGRGGMSGGYTILHMLDCIANRYAAWQVRDVGSVVLLTLLDNNDVLHDYLLFLQTGLFENAI